MKNKHYILLASIFLVTCAGTLNEDDSPLSPPEVIESNPDSIVGHWHFVRNDMIYSYWDEEEEEIAQEWTYFYMPDRSNIVFTKDSCYRVDYPIELKEGSTYQIDPFNLNVDGSLDRCRYILKEDTLVLFRFDDMNFVKQIFKRIPDEDSLIAVLKRDTINYPHFAGTWHIQWEWNTGMDDGSYYTLNYDYKIPDSISITIEQILATYLGDKKIYMRTNGKKRAYHYSYRSYRDFWERDSREFYLTPGDWYQGDSVEIHLERW